MRTVPALVQQVACLLYTSTEADFTIAMMHHSPDFLIDTQKQIIEKFICSKCNAFYYGHEHHSESKEVMYEGESSTIFELCGSLSNRGDWSKSSFYLNFLDTATEEYIQKKYNWDSQSSIYKCTYSTTKSIEIKRCTMFKLDERFSKDLYSDDKNPDVYKRQLQDIRVHSAVRVIGIF